MTRPSPGTLRSAALASGAATVLGAAALLTTAASSPAAEVLPVTCFGT